MGSLSLSGAPARVARGVTALAAVAALGCRGEASDASPSKAPSDGGSDGGVVMTDAGGEGDGGSRTCPWPTGFPAASPSTPADPLAGLQAGHPRILIRSSDVAGLRARIAASPTLTAWSNKVIASAQALVDTPPTYILDSGDGGDVTTNQARESGFEAATRLVLTNLTTLGVAYLVTDDQAFATEGSRELVSLVAQDVSWIQPKDFLDTGTLLTGIALGYDWLVNGMSEEDASAVSSALVHYAVGAVNAAYDVDGGATEENYFSTAVDNWNWVGNSGLALSALAVADPPNLADATTRANIALVVTDSYNSMQYAMSAFARDGAWAEGPVYWDFGTLYDVAVVAAFGSALGTDFGLSSLAGFSGTGDFRIQSIGPTSSTFNFSDCASASVDIAPQTEFLGRLFDEPALMTPLAYGGIEEQGNGDSPALDLLWHDDGCAAAAAPLPTSQAFVSTKQGYRADMVFMRSAWNDPNAWYVTLKGGSPDANHAHLDVGTFVLDAFGQRWVEDLGKDSYSLTNYNDGAPTSQRWTYYRTRTEGHNTLAISPTPQQDLAYANQQVMANAPLLAFKAQDATSTYGVLDMTSAYSNSPGPSTQIANYAGIASVERGIELVTYDTNHYEVLVQDEVVTSTAMQAIWMAHTQATVTPSPDGATVTLTQGGQSLTARVLAPAGATFTTARTDAASLGLGDAANPGTTNLVVKVAPSTGTAAAPVRVAVLLSEAGAPTPSIAPLSQWIGAAPLAGP